MKNLSLMSAGYHPEANILFQVADSWYIVTLLFRIYFNIFGTQRSLRLKIFCLCSCLKWSIIGKRLKEEYQPGITMRSKKR